MLGFVRTKVPFNIELRTLSSITKANLVDQKAHYISNVTPIQSEALFTSLKPVPNANTINTINTNHRQFHAALNLKNGIKAAQMEGHLHPKNVTAAQDKDDENDEDNDEDEDEDYEQDENDEDFIEDNGVKVNQSNEIPTIGDEKGLKILQVTPDQDGMRLDRFVTTMFPAINVPLFNRLSRKKMIYLKNAEKSIFKLEGNHRIKAGDLICVPGYFSFQEKPDRKISDDLLKDIVSRVLYKDDEILAIDKPHGLAVQGGNKVPIHLDLLTQALQFDAAEPPRLAHRLDKDTSGILIYGRTRKGTTRISKIFQNREGIQKQYLSLLTKNPKKREGRIVLPIPKTSLSVDASSLSRIYSTLESNPNDFKSAFTDYQVIQPIGHEGAVVKFYPETGRKHQIRIHSAYALEAPILGDTKYGNGVPESYQALLQSKVPLHLHLAQVVIRNWKGKGKDLVINSPTPPHFKDSVRKLLGGKLQKM